MKRFTFLVFILFVVFVSACSNESSTNEQSEVGKEHELRFHTHYIGVEGRAETIQNLFDEFNEQYKGKAKVVIDGTPDPQTLYDKNRTSLATDSVADIFYFQHNTVDAQRYYGSGKLIDLTPHMDGWQETFSDEAIEYGIYNEKVMAVPFESMVIPIFYNKDLFAKAGINEFPKTWDEFFEAAEKLVEIGVTPISMGTGENAWSTQLLYSYLVSSIGGEGFWEKGFDDPAFLTAAETLKKLFEYTTSDTVGLTYSAYASYFINERTAMIINGPWMIGQFIQQGGEEFHNKVGVGTMPTFDGGKGEQGAVIAGVNFVLTGKKQTDPEREKYAVEFMKYLTNPESAKRLFLASGAFMEASSFEVQEGDDADRISMEMLEVMQKAPYTFKHLINAKSTSVATEFPVAVSALALDEITPEEFVKQLQNVDN